MKQLKKSAIALALTVALMTTTTFRRAHADFGLSFAVIVLVSLTVTFVASLGELAWRDHSDDTERANESGVFTTWKNTTTGEEFMVVSLPGSEPGENIFYNKETGEQLTGYDENGEYYNHTSGGGYVIGGSYVDGARDEAASDSTPEPDTDSDTPDTDPEPTDDQSNG